MKTWNSQTVWEMGGSHIADVLNRNESLIEELGEALANVDSFSDETVPPFLKKALSAYSKHKEAM